MIERIIDGLGRVADNIWAFLLLIIAAVVAIVAHFGHDKDLLGFAGTIAMTGAALFHGKQSKSEA